MAPNRPRPTVPYVDPNDTVYQLHHQVQVRPDGYHHGVAAAVSAAAAAAAAVADDTAAAGTAAAGTVAAGTTAAAGDIAAACSALPCPFPSLSISTTCAGRLYTAGVRRMRVHRPLSLYPYLLHLIG